MQRIFRVSWFPLALLAVALLSVGLRLYGVNWDAGNSFHPDERQILFRITALGWPTSFSQFLDPNHSPLNPHFFAYGSFPLYLLAVLSFLISRLTMQSPMTFVELTLLGRVLSSLLDTGSVLLTAWLALLLTRDLGFGRRATQCATLLAAILVAFTPFQIQLSHFYTVDTLLLFFVVLTLVCCVKYVQSRHDLFWAACCGLSFGLALATKFSAAPLGLPIVVAVLLRGWRRRAIYEVGTGLLLCFILTALIFFVTQPYAWLDMHNYIDQVKEQGNMSRGSLDFPYTRQFASTIPYIYQGYNLFLWGLGVMLSLAAVAGLVWIARGLWRRKVGLTWLIPLSWLIVYSVIIGSFYVKFMRYLLPIYPLCVLLAATVLIAFVRSCWTPEPLATMAPARRRRSYGAQAISGIALLLVLAGTIFQGLALANIYSQPNTRVQASRWLYTHLPRGSLLTYELWDDSLPISVDHYDPSYFAQVTYLDGSGNVATGLPLYDDDTLTKAHLLANLLPTVDALPMASDRLDMSIPRLPARYPLTMRYYQMLFSGQLGFRLEAQFEVRPNLLGVTLDDSGADESYSVFDHPRVRIFVRQTPYPYTPEQLYQKLVTGLSLPN
ncbi:glycosyltransferase family 39 protein [Ktedonospora formicarum]|uniref:Glycosyltransferase RgtA/B/C/D-like domain-containing protein n=1 Tax=Ktedonospora formicarum TaxID=2778364 RepID=A0A8J3I1D1_9CHLR|nr:glycosyltransferase family 39 protein [Ktedonospora formicarum]GHO43119.1 hypothetical protein KSX_12820 [Ktedonospora formicarum]